MPGYGAKRHPDGQRADGLTHDGRLSARRERIFVVLLFGAMIKSAQNLYLLFGVMNIRAAKG